MNEVVCFLKNIFARESKMFRNFATIKNQKTFE